MYIISSVQLLSRSDSLWPHESQHARLPYHQLHNLLVILILLSTVMANLALNFTRCFVKYIMIWISAVEIIVLIYILISTVGIVLAH